MKHKQRSGSWWRHKNRYLWLLLIFCGSMVVAGFKPHPLDINFNLVFNGQPLQLGNTYTSNNNDTLRVEGFRFYVSNFCVYKNGRATRLKNTYYLVDAAKKESQHIILPNVTPPVDSIQVMIGVDSVANVLGALDGALDPANGMYWAWNTGYIHAKLEGSSNSCKTLHHAFEFHIGGYTRPYVASRTIRLKLAPGNAPIVITADAARWLDNIHLKDINSVVIPGQQACMIANNYAHMLSITP